MQVAATEELFRLLITIEGRIAMQREHSLDKKILFFIEAIIIFLRMAY